MSKPSDRPESPFQFRRHRRRGSRHSSAPPSQGRRKVRRFGLTDEILRELCHNNAGQLLSFEPLPVWPTSS